MFAHYQAFGESENRAPTTTFAAFDSAAYLTANTDVAAAVTAGTCSPEHFCWHRGSGGDLDGLHAGRRSPCLQERRTGVEPWCRPAGCTRRCRCRVVH